MNKKEESQPSYYAIIPADVRYDASLPPNAKLLYGEITALCNQKGYCWASNKYFAELYGVTKVSVSTWISALAERGYIQTEVDKGNIRCIYIKDSYNTDLKNLEDPLKKSLIPNKEIFKYNNKYNTKGNTKVDNNTSNEPHPSKNKEAVEVIFEFWNSYKSTGRWQSHRKLTHDMVLAIMENLKSYSREDICAAIDNYATVLQKEEYFWDHIWPLSTFLTVKYEKRKDGPKKWWQFLPENFMKSRYLRRENRKELPDPDLVGPNPELTKKIIRRYGLYIGRRDYTPLPHEFPKFVEATKRMMDFYKGKPCQDVEVWITDLFEYLDDRYGNSGDLISPGHLCSDKTWLNDMPQYLKSLGVS